MFPDYPSEYHAYIHLSRVLISAISYMLYTGGFLGVCMFFGNGGADVHDFEPFGGSVLSL